MKRANQRGSAMLIVFVFAAIVAIGLFTEMPVIIFEAQRNKEQLLVDRGNEYIQAVKLYRRKTGQFPPNLDALENTNRLRFLRKKFKDPFTDKADWRLLHAGPNGMLTDSKLKVAQNVTGAGNSALGTFNSNGTNQASAFGGSTPGNTGFGSGFNTNNNVNNQGFGAANQANPPIPGQTSGGENANFQNGIGNPNGTDPTLNPNQPNQSNQPNQQAWPGGFVQPLPNPDGTMPASPRNASPVRRAIPNGTNGIATGIVDPTQTAGGYASSSNGMPNADPNATQSNPNAAVGGLVSNPNPATPQNNGFNTSGNQSSPFANNGSNTNSAFGNNAFGNTSSNGGFSNSGNANSSSGFGSSSSGFGSSNNSSTIQSGGLAGVASKVERHSIKVVNDQQDYSLWEFYYDPTKDPALNAAGAALAGNGGTTGQPGNSPIQSGNAFGQQQNGNGQSPFGQSGSFGRRNEGLNNFGSSNNSFGAGSGFSNGNNQNTTSGQQQQTGAPPSPQLPPQ